MMYGGYSYYFYDIKGFLIQSTAGFGYIFAGPIRGFMYSALIFTGYLFRWDWFCIDPRIYIGGAYAGSTFLLKYGWRLNIGALF